MAKLKKGPDIQDYVVETIVKKMSGESKSYRYFMTRAEARKFAKAQAARTRIFRIKYTLVADQKRKGKK